MIQKLKEERKKRGLTQVDIAKRIDVNKSTIGSWENGSVSPTIDNIIKYAKEVDHKILCIPENQRIAKIEEL